MTLKINIFAPVFIILNLMSLKMNSPDIRKFCCDTCHWTQQLPTRYNLGRDKKIPVATEIGFCKQKSVSRHHMKVVATLFLLSFTLVSKFIVAIGKTMSKHHNSVSSVTIKLLMS